MKSAFLVAVLVLTVGCGCHAEVADSPRGDENPFRPTEDLSGVDFDRVKRWNAGSGDPRRYSGPDLSEVTHDCGDFALKVSLQFDPPYRNTLENIWSDNEYLWISPGGPFAEPKRHWFQMPRHSSELADGQLGRIWDVDEYVLVTSYQRPTRIYVRRSVNSPDDFPLNDKYRPLTTDIEEQPHELRLINILIETPSGERSTVVMRLVVKDRFDMDYGQCWGTNARVRDIKRGENADE